jgi:Bacterial regulatory proteins, tetR family
MRCAKLGYCLVILRLLLLKRDRVGAGIRLYQLGFGMDGLTTSQARTQETRSKILDAAEAVFSEQGFEKTQLEEVATRVERSMRTTPAKKTFFWRLEHRVLTELTAVGQLLEAEPEVRKRPGIFMCWIASQVSDRSWGTLM